LALWPYSKKLFEISFLELLQGFSCLHSPAIGADRWPERA
jgi:hypothetical protein